MWTRFKTAWKMARSMEQKSITPMQTLPTYANNKPIWKDWSTDNAVAYGYKSSTWVYSCVSRIAKTAASVPWKVYRETDEGLEEIPNHPLELLLKKPNPFMSGQDMFERMVGHLYLGGNGILSKVKVNNVVAELWPVMPDAISPIPSKTDFVAGYEYRANGITYEIPADEILHFMFIDPANLYWGLAPLQAVARSVDTDSEMLDWQKVSLQNRAIADGVFSFKQPLTRQQWEDARAMVRDQHQGSGGARTPWVLGGEANWTQMSLTPAEMDFIQSRNFTREEICSVFNVPPPMVGLYENATLNNIETARKIFWLDTMIPLLEDLKSSFNLALTPEFGEGLVLSYDISSVQAIQDNYGEKVATAKELWSMGLPFNEINQRLELGFDEIEGGEVGYLPLNLMIAGTDPTQATTDSTSTDGNVNVNDDINLDAEPSVAGYKPRNQKAWNLDTEEQKELYWKNLDSRRNAWSGQFSKRVEDLFQSEAKAVAKAYQDGGADSAFKAIEIREDTWSQLYKAMYLAVIEDFGENTWDLLKSQGPTKTKAFDPWDDFIQLWVANRAADMVKNVLDTTKDLIRNVIALGQEEGLSVVEIAKAIRERYDGFTKRRAEVIARTETVASSNFGSMASAKQTGLNPKKVWVSSRDKRVRDTHEGVDGTMVGIDEEFHVGGDAMLHPGGGSKASENVNCRCTLSYRVVR
ncbi:phage portal protein, HK97 family [Priestia aryabhattai B8W22]|uniref:phage portal protein n=1 Tax=Priestia aryabhattai TaxID=412384 RepID=UPI000887715C|nr:phage portal protein, HK97 family [Priestia aryabhattai B8W22]